MFTGLVQGLGRVDLICQERQEGRFRITPLFKMPHIQDGESIAVNGVCLSVENHQDSTFTVYASRETMSRTNLDLLKKADEVNLERALALGERLGGHMVSGHVDCLAIVNEIKRSGESLFIRLKFPSAYASEVIAKGSVALNGISLTINACGSDWLEVNIIPDSQKRTDIVKWHLGSKINMETDLIGKYVVNYMRNIQKNTAISGITRDFLTQNGFV